MNNGTHVGELKLAPEAELTDVELIEDAAREAGMTDDQIATLLKTIKGEAS